jgi:two-component system NtrC family sensor kinase
MNERPLIFLPDSETELVTFLQNEFDVQPYSSSVPFGSKRCAKAHLIAIDISDERQATAILQQLASHFVLSDVPTIAIGPSDQTSVLGSYKKGFMAYIKKPYSVEESAWILRTHANIHQQKNQSASKVSSIIEELTNELIHSARLATLGTLSASVAHEINNPMAFISSNVQTLDRYWSVAAPFLEKELLSSPDDRQLKFVLDETPISLARILDGVKRVSKIVSHLKSFSLWKRGENKPVDINACIDQALLLLSSVNENRIAIERKLPPDLPKVNGDMQQITQVFTNIMTNAIHAMQDNNESPQMILSAVVESEHLQLLIEDNGSGISEGESHKIWDPFYTTKNREIGTGLGLSICKKIIESHEGEISLDNRTEGGARCKIRLPRSQEVIT